MGTSDIEALRIDSLCECVRDFKDAYQSVRKAENKVEETKNNEIKKEKIKKVINYNEDLSKTFISLDELDQIGKYKKIETVPEGMFKIKMSEQERSKKAS